jgi:VWFA-related protein
MKNRIIAVISIAVVLAMPTLAQNNYTLLQSVSVLAQIAQFSKPSPVEKELAARASHVDEITLDKKTLSFATQFMNPKQSVNPQDEEATRKLMESLDGMYVRDYKFDKEGQFTAGQIEQLRADYESSDWSPMVRNRDRKSGESSDVMIKLVNGESHGLFILDVEPKEVSIVLILGPVHMQDLQKVMRIAGRGSLPVGGGMTKGLQVKEKNKGPLPQNTKESLTVLHATTRLVLVDVHVSGHGGVPVQGLSKSDFEVKENGVHQEIKGFDEHSPKIDRSELPALDFQLPAHTYVNLEPAARKGPPVVIVFDQLNSSLDAQMYAYGQIIKFLEKKDAGTEVAIFAIGDRLTMLQGFTTDTRRLIAAMKSPVGKPKLTVWGGNSFLSHDPAVCAGGFQAAQLTLDAFAELGQFLAAASGRKNLLWFSSSFQSLQLPSGADYVPAIGFTRGCDNAASYTNLSARTHKVSTELAVSQTAVYPIDARGLEADPSFSSEAGSSGQFARNSASWNQWLYATQATMLEIAEATGGEAFMNTNNLAHAASKAVDEGSYYYTISYSPTNDKFDGRLRRIQVRLKKLDSGLTYHLSYRTAYFADDPAAVVPVSAKRNALEAALVNGAPNAQSILFKVQADPDGPVKLAPQVSPQANALASKAKMKDHSAGESVSEKVQTYTLRFAITTGQLKLTKVADGRSHGVLDIAVAAYAADGRRLGGSQQHFEAAIPPQVLDKFSQEGFFHRMSVDVPVDAARIRVVVRDPASGRVGSVEIALPL